MKQTNNAIKFLMAQYRAIFKNAYFKGMATALVLTAGLATGAAQAATSGYVLQNSTWKWMELEKDAIGSNSILAGAIAGNNLDDLADSIDQDKQAAIKANGSASNATIYIGNVPAGALGTGYMKSGAAAGGWATTSGSMTAEASNNTVIVNGTGYVDKGGVKSRGVIHGGRANSTEGFAVASGNIIRVEKANTQEARNKAAAEEKIVGGTALGFTGATASNNQVIIKGTEQHRQVVAAGDRVNTLFGLTGGTVQIKKSGASGTYEASNNSLELTAISVSSENKAFLFVAGRADLSSGTAGSAKQLENGSGIANNNSVRLSDSVINTSGGTLWANNIEGGSGSVSTKIDGNGRGISISDSSITSTDNLILRASSLTNNKSTGSTIVNNSRIEIANTSINVTGTGTGTSGEITGAYVQNVASSNVEAANNTISITEESSNYKADTKTFTRSITADITGAEVKNTYNTDQKLVINATGNSINVGTAVSVTGDVVGASVSASGDKFATMNLSDNSVSVAGKVVGNVKAVNFTNTKSSGEVSGSVSFLNNDVSLLNGADVSSGDLVGGAGKNSVITIAAGSTYTANQATNKIASDVIDIDGTVIVEAGKTLNISGFYENGLNTATKYHENLTTVGSSAVIKNAGTINIYGKVMAENGAVFTGTGANSEIVVDGDSSKQAAMNDLLDDEDRVENADFGVLGMSSAQLTSYLAADKVLNNTNNDIAGKLVLQSGGALELTDTGNVDIATTFNFTSGSAVAGQIQVDANDQKGGSIIRGNEITVSRQLASNAVTAGNITAATTYEGLTATGMTGIQIEANTLHLGASDLSSAKSEDILFDKATAKNVINFYGLHNDSTEEDIKNDGFHLVSDVYGDNYMVTTNQDTGLDYYTALDGDINGDVTITNDSTSPIPNSGSLTIQNGNWVAHGNVTLNESGSLVVGGDDGIDETGAANQAAVNSPDATLAFDNDLVVDLSDPSTETKITAQGVLNDYTKRYDFEKAAETIGDDRLAQIDLRNGLTIVGQQSDGKFQGKTTITATSGGVILLDSTDLNTILTQNDANGTESTSGAFFVANSGGAFIVTGDVNADFDDFNASGSSSTVNGITLADNGYLVADSVTISNAGETGLNTAKDEGNSYDFKEVAWGNGTIDVDDLVISDLQTTNGTTKPSGATVYASKVTVTEGDALIHKSLTSNNNTLILGVEDGASEANFTFATDAVANEGAISVNNLQVLNGSSLTFLNGTWDATSTTVDLGASGTLTVGGDSHSDINDQDTYATLNALGLKMAAGADATIAADGKATFARADFSALTVGSNPAGDPQNVNVYGHLIINGDTSATITQNNAQVDDPKNGVAFGAEGTLQIRNNGILEFSGAAVNGAIIADADYSTAASVTEAMVDGYTKIANYGGVLKLNFASGTEFGAEAIKQLKTELFTAGSLNDGVLTAGGILNIGDGSFHGINNPTALEGEGLSGYTAKWEDVKDFSDIYGNDVTNNTLMQTNVSDIRVGDQVQGHWGSLSMASDSATSAQVTIAGHTTLNYAEGNRGYFISNASRNAALGADVQAQKSLKLVNNGTEASIGNVTLQGVTDDSGNALDVDTNFTTLEVTGAGTTTIRSVNGIGGIYAQGYADGTAFKVSANTNVTEGIDNIEYVDVANASLSAQNADVHSINGINGNITIADTASFNEAEVLGGTFSTKLANYDHLDSDDNSVLVSNGGTFSAEKFVFTDNTGGIGDGRHGYLEVGIDLSLLSAEDLTLDDGSKVTTGAGYFEAGVMELNGNTIVVDPEYGDNTSVAAVGKFQLNDRQTYKYDNDKGVLEGELLIGKNAAFGVGATLAETKEAISTYQQNGSLQEDNYGSILYLNDQLTVSDGSIIALNSSKDAKTDADIRESNKYVITTNEHNQYAALGLGANTAILMTENAFEDDKGAKTGTAIYFDRKAAVVNGAGGDIILAGDFDAAEKLNIFNDKDNNGVRVEGSIDVRTQNGFLMYTLSGEDAGMGVQLEVDKAHAYGIMSDASDPVIETLIAYHTERGGATTDSNTNAGDNSSGETVPASVTETQQASTVAQAENRSGAILDPSDTPTETPDNPDQGQGGASGDEGDAGTGGSQDTPQTSNVRGYSSFLSMVSNNTHGAPAEAAARLAIYGGAVQAAMAATSSTTDAIAARMGVGNTANITMANNGQGAALWLAPVYKTHDSDSFDSQGLDYGVDLNLYGVALGADFEFMPGLTAGIMFNVGSGDADGQGNTAANNTSNDFDYWGAAIYGNYTYDALSVTADVSYTAVDNDLEATTGMDQFTKLESSTDTTAISLGVTAKYTFDLAGVEVAPHAGLRYTNIDLDDYSIKSNGETIADYSADKVNIFSIPVGVTFAKEFTGDAWTVKPSLDLTLTGNFGDDDISGDVSWTGVDGLVTPVSSEYMDDFTYGATLGIEAASTGGFSLGLGVNYTGSSNVDEFGVNANARFVF